MCKSLELIVRHLLDKRYKWTESAYALDTGFVVNDKLTSSRYVCIATYAYLYKGGQVTGLHAGVTMGGNDRWVEWLTERSPLAHHYDKTPLIILGHDIHSLRFRQDYGLVFTSEECSTLPALQIFAMVKGFIVGWGRKGLTSTAVMFDLMDAGVDDKTAFHMMTITKKTKDGFYIGQQFIGGHDHFYSDRRNTDALFTTGFSRAGSSTLLKARNDYTGVDGVYFYGATYMTDSLPPGPTRLKLSTSFGLPVYSDNYSFDQLLSYAKDFKW